MLCDYGFVPICVLGTNPPESAACCTPDPVVDQHFIGSHGGRRADNILSIDLEPVFQWETGK